MTAPTPEELEAVRARARGALDKLQSTLVEVMDQVKEIEAVGIVIRLPGQTLIQVTDTKTIARAMVPFVCEHAGGYLLELAEQVPVHEGKGPKDTTPPPVH